jgi:hypothetical protein
LLHLFFRNQFSRCALIAGETPAFPPHGAQFVNLLFPNQFSRCALIAGETPAFPGTVEFELKI